MVILATRFTIIVVLNVPNGTNINRYINNNFIDRSFVELHCFNIFHPSYVLHNEYDIIKVLPIEGHRPCHSCNNACENVAKTLLIWLSNIFSKFEDPFADRENWNLPTTLNYHICSGQNQWCLCNDTRSGGWRDHLTWLMLTNETHHSIHQGVG